MLIVPFMTSSVGFGEYRFHPDTGQLWFRGEEVRNEAERDEALLPVDDVLVLVFVLVEDHSADSVALEPADVRVAVLEGQVRIPGSNPAARPTFTGSFRRDGLHLIPETWVTPSGRRGSRSARADTSRHQTPQVIVHEREEPDALAHLADAHQLAGEHLAYIDRASAVADPATRRDRGRPVMQGVLQRREAVIGPRG